jgi:hypothetical protein
MARKASDSAVSGAMKDIETTSKMAGDLRNQVGDLQSQISGYREVNKEMEKLKDQFHGQTSDLTKLDLRVHTLETVPGPEETQRPSFLSFANSVCPSSPAKGTIVAYCAQGSPLSLFQVTPTGAARPVSSLSSVGFQDVSTAPRSACTQSNRGTFYVEKGVGISADKPFLCVRKSDNTYDWIQLAVVP